MKIKEFFDKYQSLFVSAFFFVLFVAIIFVSGMLLGCKTLTIHKESKVESCNKWYTIMDYNLQMGIKDNALVLKLLDRCLSDSDKIKVKKIEDRKKDCRKWIYRGKTPDKDDFRSKIYYDECIK